MYQNTDTGRQNDGSMNNMQSQTSNKPSTQGDQGRNDNYNAPVSQSSNQGRSGGGMDDKRDR